MADVDTVEDVYDLGIMRFGDNEITCKSFKISYKIKAESKSVTNKLEGVGWKLSELEYSWEASEIEEQYMKIIKDRFKAQKNDKNGLTISTYNFTEGGEYVEGDVLYSCIITDIDVEQESGATFDVKGDALRAK